MGFISFNESYYRGKLETYEGRPLSNADIYEAKQLLKVLDDLADEGYTDLNNRMESDFSCMTRLRVILRKCGELPFPIDHGTLPNTTYGQEEHELEGLLEELVAEAYDTSRSPRGRAHAMFRLRHRTHKWYG